MTRRRVLRRLVWSTLFANVPVLLYTALWGHSENSAVVNNRTWISYKRAVFIFLVNDNYVDNYFKVTLNELGAFIRTEFFYVFLY